MDEVENAVEEGEDENAGANYYINDSIIFLIYLNKQYE